MHPVRRLLRWLYAALAVFMLAYASGFFLHYTDWHQERLYTRMEEGTRQEQIAAVLELVEFDGEEQLLRGLKSDAPQVRKLCSQGLKTLWHTEAGHDAARLVQSAQLARREAKYLDALKMLDRVVRQNPDFAEAWTQRALLYYQLKHPRLALADCERALALNPAHCDAWHTRARVHYRLGDYFEARLAVKELLKINPYHAEGKKFLGQCEERLRQTPVRLNPALDHT
ncbi:MAG: tetratricopeptide repeat protein [Verrucomicrobiota bacterium]